MERELTPVEARSGVVSGRIITILIISTTAAIIALGLAWVLVFSGT
jgi:NADH:ubiquinone oxidoreductase subunit K